MKKSTEKRPGLREQDIRPVELMKGQEIALLTDIGRLLTKRAEFVHVSCPACKEDKTEHRFDKFGLNYEECVSCQTLYVNPRPGPVTLQWFYRESANYAYWNKHIYPASEEARRSRVIAPRVDRVLDCCEKFSVQTGSILEVGAGFGTFCEMVDTRGRFDRVVGIEPTPDLAATCRSKGVEVLESSVEKVDFPEDQRFDVVVSFEVIEHLFSPEAFIAQCRGFLKKNGLLILSCPNYLGFDLQTLGPLSKTIDHEHLNYFTPASLSALVESAGLSVVDKKTPGKLDAELVRNEVLAGKFELRGQAFLHKVLIDEWETLGSSFQDFLAENLLSSSLWVIAQNK